MGHQIVKGIFYCADVALTAANDRTAEIEITPGQENWSGLFCISASAKSGAATLQMADNAAKVIIDPFSGYSAVVSAAAVPSITLAAAQDATIRVLIEKL